MLADNQTIPVILTEALFQKPYRRVVLILLDRAMLECSLIFTNRLVEPVDESLESWQSGRKGSACAAEKYNAPVFVGPDQALGNIGPVRYELHDPATRLYKNFSTRPGTHKEHKKM